MMIHRHGPRRTRAALFTLPLLALLLAFVPAATARAQETAENNSLKVDFVQFPVTLSDGNVYNVAGYLYYHGSHRNRPLQVLVHGGTYNHLYWDAPGINGRSYSYARYMAARKYAVLAIDQLGTGASSKPDGDFLTLSETASALHQVLARLRTDANPAGHPFEHIALVGHSFGSINSVLVQAAHRDADALVVTALGHVPHELPIPADLIAQLAQYPYFTLPPEARAALFYHAPAADPAVIAYDNANMVDNLTRGQLFTTFFAIFNPAADHVGEVEGPVLVQLGENDALFSSAYAAGEAGYWTSASSVTVQSLPRVGHDFNTHLDNSEGWRLIDAWLSSVMPD
jgi:pimeloyl-ACP methyl ester carboxylesterase